MSFSWAIYYRNGYRFTSDDGTWDDAPSEGVMVVVEKIGTRVTLHSGADHYQLEDDGTIVMRDARTLLCAIGIVAMSPVKFGWYGAGSVFERCLARARDEWI